MKNYRNQLDRFRDIAKKLVDEHSAELFTHTSPAETKQAPEPEAYYSHLDVLGKQLDEQAKIFITSYKSAGDSLITDVWHTCKNYLDQFAKRNQPIG